RAPRQCPQLPRHGVEIDVHRRNARRLPNRGAIAVTGTGKGLSRKLFGWNSSTIERPSPPTRTGNSPAPEYLHVVWVESSSRRRRRLPSRNFTVIRSGLRPDCPPMSAVASRQPVADTALYRVRQRFTALRQTTSPASPRRITKPKTRSGSAVFASSVVRTRVGSPGSYTTVTPSPTAYD